jgi:hypothetical protein
MALQRCRERERERKRDSSEYIFGRWSESNVIMKKGRKKEGIQRAPKGNCPSRLKERKKER